MISWTTSLNGCLKSKGRFGFCGKNGCRQLLVRLPSTGFSNWHPCRNESVVNGEELCPITRADCAGGARRISTYLCTSWHVLANVSICRCISMNRTQPEH